MKYRILIILTFLTFLLPGCSYVSDTIEGAITDRAGFSINAVYDGSKVTLTWDETGGSNFAGYEIYRTKIPNDEYAEYEIIAGRFDDYSSTPHFTGTAALGIPATSSFEDDLSYLPGGNGVYFYRVGIIDWDENSEDRTAENGYTGITEDDYEDNTDIGKVSGYARVVID